MIINKLIKLASLFTVLFAFSITVQGKSIVEYQVSITQPDHHLANISFNIPKGKATAIVKLPNWRTGNYRIINQANGIREFDAKTSKGKSLQWHRVDKSTWEIQNPTLKAIDVSYLLYANELGRRTRHIDNTHAYLDATAVLMYEPSMMYLPHIVK